MSTIFLVYLLLACEIITFFSSTVTHDSVGLNSTSLDDSHEAFFDENQDRFRGRLPTHLSSSGYGADGIKPVSSLFSAPSDTHDE